MPKSQSESADTSQCVAPDSSAVRNTASSYWTPWLTRGYRCLVPTTSFCEYTDSLPKVPHWFALTDDRPLFAFAGIWRKWTGVRGKEEGEQETAARR